MKELPMSDERQTRAVSSPCLIVAHPDANYEAEVARGFRRLGWDVYHAKSGPEVRRLVPMLEADAVILDAELRDETGWLTCEKLTAEQPLVKVLLVTSEPGPRNHQLAAFVGASALVSHSDGLAALIEELCGRPVPAAG
jgi:DNA-binding response OmpR family regulator